MAALHVYFVLLSQLQAEQLLASLPHAWLTSGFMSFLSNTSEFLLFLQVTDYSLSEIYLNVFFTVALHQGYPDNESSSILNILNHLTEIYEEE